MASRNSVKIYSPNSYYHLYNRGVEKRKIFLDDQDYSVFLSYLKTYLTPKDEANLQALLVSDANSSERDKALKLLKMKNYADDLELICYVLMPNHYHLLIKQKATVLNHFANSLGTRYAMYFNRKYKRQGVLFQDVYKAVLVSSEEQLIHLSRYIHLNPIKAQIQTPSSLPEFEGQRNTAWIKPKLILDYFAKSHPQLDYKKFLGMSVDTEVIRDISIDIDQTDFARGPLAKLR